MKKQHFLTMAILAGAMTLAAQGSFASASQNGDRLMAQWNDAGLQSYAMGPNPQGPNNPPPPPPGQPNLGNKPFKNPGNPPPPPQGNRPPNGPGNPPPNGPGPNNLRPGGPGPNGPQPGGPPPRN